MKNKNKIIATTVLVFSLMSQNVFALAPGHTGSYNIDEAKETKKEAGYTQPVGGNKPTKTPVVSSEEIVTKKPVVHTGVLVGTFKRPYFITIRTPKGNMDTLKSSVKKAMDNVPDNNTTYDTYKIPAVETSKTTETTMVPDYIENASNPFYVRYVYSTIKIKATNTTVKKTTSKDKYYKWNLSGPKSWSEESATTSVTLRFDTPGTYTLSVVPFEERTLTISGSSSALAYETWPDEYNRKSETIHSTSKTIPATTTVAVAENKARRKEWVIVITSADINTDIIPIIPPTPPPGGSDDPLNGVTVDPSLNITIVE